MYEDTAQRIFIVEDDPTYVKFIQYVLELNPDHEIQVFSSGKDCLDHLHEKPALITLDYRLPDMPGLDVLKKIKAFDSSIPVIVLSGQEKIGTAVELLKAGAYDYIIKDEETKDRLLHAIDQAKKNVALVKEINHLREEISGKYEFSKSLIGNSGALKKIFALMEKAAKTQITVSVNGETGTGKELVAKAIHYNSTRKNKSFVPVNIAAIPSDLIESELFGHEKGAFTGASSRRIGKFEEAQGGTIFLDEIGEMPLNLQSKLLRVLQEKEITRIGSNKTISLDVRVITATHRNLTEEVKNGNFREDLYYRLLGLPIFLPPLRERDKDVILLAQYFLQEFIKENQMEPIQLSSDAKEKLLKYSFPGNVRELKSVIELAAVLNDNNEIHADHIQFNSLKQEENLFMKEMSLKDYTYKIILYMLDKYDKNVLEVARRLDIGKSTIYRYLKEMEEEKIIEHL